MVINSESLQGFSASINESKTMYFSTGKVECRDARIQCTIDSYSIWGTIEVVFTIDQVVVGNRDTRGVRVVCLLFQDYAFGSTVVPVCLG